MRLVDRPHLRPSVCAAIPFIGPAGHPEERWVDTGIEMPGFDNHIYLSETAVREAGKLFGYPTAADIATVERERDEALDELSAALTELSELRAVKAVLARATAPKAKAAR